MLIGYWSRNPDHGPIYHGVKSALSTHAHLIAVISPNEKVQKLLGKALVRYQEDQWFRVKKEIGYFWPMREEATDLVSALRAHVGR
jgi:hypothetical protein